MRLVEAYPVKLVCKTLDYSRSHFYYRPKQREDEALREAVRSAAGTWPTYGSRRIAAQLRREGFKVNRKRVMRLMSEMGLKGKSYRRKKRTTNSSHSFPRFPNMVQDLQVVRPEQVWVSDISYVRLRQEFVYLAVVMDVFTRCIRGWHLGRGLDQELALTALQRAMACCQPETHHSDQGVQYASTAYVQLLLEAGVQISMAEVGQAWQNGYAERLIRTIKEEEVELSEYQDYWDAYNQMGQFLEELYMHKRIHSALGYLTPLEFEAQWLAQQPIPERVH